MKPIWYFVGLILMTIGSVILLTGVYLWFNPAQKVTVLSNTHPNLWWGAIMVIAGALYVIKNKNVTV